MTLEDDLSADEKFVADSNCWNNVVGGLTSTPLKIAGLTVDLSGDVTVGVASPADLARLITVGVASSADPASVVPTGVTFREECGDNVVIHTDCVCDYDEIDEVASSADLA